MSQGAVLLEAVLVLPVAFLLLGSLIELAGLFVTYLEISDIAYEGARFASQVNSLEYIAGRGAAWSCSNAGTVSACTAPVDHSSDYPGTDVSPPRSHQLVHDRISLLLLAKS